MAFDNRGASWLQRGDAINNPYFGQAMLRCGEIKETIEKVEPAPKPQTYCPIMGGEIDKSVYVDYKGKRIYFCCPGCKEPFLKHADEHLAKMAAEGIDLQEVPHDR
jgi:YHS domain-containing protein